MRQITFIICIILTSLNTQGQQNLFPETFPNTNDINEIVAIRDCNDCKPATNNEVFERYIFDINGLNTIRYSICDNEICGKQTYNYIGEKLVSYQNHSTWVSTLTDGDFGMVWNADLLSNEVQYEYEGEHLINIIVINGVDSEISFEINYSYDTEERLKEEEIWNYPDPNSFGQFEPNTNKWVDNPDAKRLLINKKKYEYIGDSCIISYYKEGTFTAIETKEKNSRGETIKSTLKSSNGKILNQEINTFNDEGQLIEKRIIDTGYDGFGNLYDFLGYDKETYKYSPDGKLISIMYYRDGKVAVEEKYKYKK